MGCVASLPHQSWLHPHARRSWTSTAGSLRSAGEPDPHRTFKWEDNRISGASDSRLMAVSSEPASAVVYCQYISYPVGCVARTASPRWRDRSREPR